MQNHKSVGREYLEALLIAVIFATFARTYVIQAFKIPSGSMEQNLLIGDHILVNKFIYGPTLSPLETRLLPVRPVTRGDVVVFKFPQDPTRDFIKRCVGLPGDRVELIDKQLFLNGRMVHDDTYTYHTDSATLPRTPLVNDGFRNRDNFGPREVPKASYFCMGDNRDNSNDSRFWGEVPASYVKGRAFMIYWSFDTGESEIPETPNVRAKLHQLAQVGLKFFAHTRWNRTFRIVR
ncbi:MAG TPA: signal peptidase I [Thermoanaerobaculia bacterium]|nr:signal peptidase I [Thermoanaerobaculia bacterium]